MKTKLLAMMLLAGGSMFAQNRFSVGIGLGGNGDFNQPPAYAYDIPQSPGPDYTWVDGYWNQQPFFGGYAVAPRFDSRFRDDDRREFNRGFDAERNRGFEQGWNRGFNQNQGRDFGRNQNNRERGEFNRQGNESSNRFRGR